MNSVQLVGRLARDPEVKYTDGGTSIARFTTAVDRKFSKEGENHADFIYCVAFGKTAEVVEKYFFKGMKIGVVGRIQTGSYENKDGQTVYTMNVVAESVEFVEKKGESSAPSKPDKDGFVGVPEGSAEELPFN